MSDDAKKYFTGLLNKVNGLQFILLHDRDGIILMKLAKDSKFSELGTKQPFLSTFGIASDQASKMGLGKNQTIISMFSNYQVIQMNKMPLVLTFVGAENMNTGHILAVENEINSFLDDFKSVLSITEPM